MQSLHSKLSSLRYWSSTIFWNRNFYFRRQLSELLYLDQKHIEITTMIFLHVDRMNKYLMTQYSYLHYQAIYLAQ